MIQVTSVESTAEMTRDKTASVFDKPNIGRLLHYFTANRLAMFYIIPLATCCIYEWNDSKRKPAWFSPYTIFVYQIFRSLAFIKIERLERFRKKKCLFCVVIFK